MKKYYILKRIKQTKNPLSNIVNVYLCEFDIDTYPNLEKRVKQNHDYILVEKTCNKDNTESYTNMWTCADGCDFDKMMRNAKSGIIYDYTGAFNIVHEKGNIRLL